MYAKMEVIKHFITSILGMHPAVPQVPLHKLFHDQLSEKLCNQAHNVDCLGVAPCELLQV